MFSAQMSAFKILILLFSVQGALSVCYDDEDCVHKSVTDGFLKLTVHLLKELTDTVPSDDNLIFSSANIELALAMVDVGAYGETHEEIEDTMHIDRYFSEFHKHYTLSEVQKGIQNTDDGNTVRVANGIFVAEDAKVTKQYNEDIIWYYNASAKSLNFYNQPEAQYTINEYVSNETNGLIPELFTEYLPVETKVCLVSVLYLNAIWKYPFDPAETVQDFFYSESGSFTLVDIMTAQNTIPYANYSVNCDCTKKVQIIGLPYKGEKMYMYIILPQEGYSIRDLIDDLEPDDICDIINGTELKNVFYQVPCFEYEWSATINDQLEEIGMKKAFTDYSELDMLEGCQSLKISTVVHAAKIKSCENGTEAAAATGVVAVPTSIQEYEEYFRADRAFLYIIWNKEHSVALFTGFVNQPNGT